MATKVFSIKAATDSDTLEQDLADAIEAELDQGDIVVFMERKASGTTNQAYLVVAQPVDGKA